MVAIQLTSQDHRDLLDVVDKLRSEGVNRYVNLPQIVVCGDQSAGKSSVLEAISGLSFPTKDNLCTRFATELILRRDESVGISVSITPGHDRSLSERQDLFGFKFELDVSNPDVSGVTEAAKRAMGISESKPFSRDSLRIEMKGPQLPHLTLVDLPGLFRASNREQSVDSAPLVNEMVRDYIKMSRSIILAVVSAQSDISLQPVTELSREFDPAGSRTLGLITKPDLLPAGSESQASFVDLARNKDIVFRLGWHVLRNRSFETRTAIIAERNKAERDLFESEPWAQLDRGSLGIDSLRPRLSALLKDQILQQLPSLLEEVSEGIDLCERTLRDLGVSRDTLTEKQRYLREISWSFSLLMTGAVHGHYSDAFFGRASTDEGYRRRLRAVVQDALQAFADTMREQGRAQLITGPYEDTSDGDAKSVPRIARSAYLEHVKLVMRRNRGCELPGTFNPMVVQELFHEQCMPWRDIVSSATRTIVQAVRDTVRTILRSIAASETVDALIDQVLSVVDQLEHSMESKTEEILSHHVSGHPITYNHYLTDTVQRMQNDRRSSIQVNMETYAGELAIDYMQAYYKVAMKRFVDDFSVLSVETEMMQKLATVFDTTVVDDLSDDEVSILATESEQTAVSRARHEKKLLALKMAFQEFQKFKRDRATLSEQLVEADHEQGVCTPTPSPRAEDVEPDIINDLQGIAQTSVETIVEAVEPPTLSGNMYFGDWGAPSNPRKKKQKARGLGA